MLMAAAACRSPRRAAASSPIVGVGALRILRRRCASFDGRRGAARRIAPRRRHVGFSSSDTPS